MPGLIGKKVGMTSVFSVEGKSIPCTVIECGPCVVTQVKTIEKDGYEAVQVGFGDKRESLVNKPMKGQFSKAGVSCKRFVREFKFENAEDYKVADEIKADIFAAGDKIDANQKQQAEQLKTELKTALDNNDMTTLEAKMSELEQMAQQMASYAYQQQQANPNGGAGQTTSNNNDDNVVDADFEEKN